jgi:hypothetical protein
MPFATTTMKTLEDLTTYVLHDHCGRDATFELDDLRRRLYCAINDDDDSNGNDDDGHTTTTPNNTRKTMAELRMSSTFQRSDDGTDQSSWTSPRSVQVL